MCHCEPPLLNNSCFSPSMFHCRYLAPRLRTACLFVLLSTAVHAVYSLSNSSTTPVTTTVDALPTTASGETSKCTSSIVLPGGTPFPVGALIDDSNDWPLLFPGPSTHLCYADEVAVPTVPYADDPTASPALTTHTISEAIFPNATDGMRIPCPSHPTILFTPDVPLQPTAVLLQHFRLSPKYLSLSWPSFQQ